MGSYTPNYNLYKPAIGEVGWGDEINTSTDTVDATLGSLASVSHVAVTAGTAISVVGQQVTNTAPDQTVAITGGSNVTIGGTYPNFVITDNSQTADAGLTSLAGLTYAAPAFVKLTAAETFTLDTTLYLPQALTDTYIFVGNGSGVATGVQMTGDVTITNAGVTTVSIALDDLTDVVTPAPNVDDYLRFNGTNWVNATGGSVSAGPSSVFYLDNDTQNGAYQTLLANPDTVTPEEQDTVTVNNSEALILGYLYNTALDNTIIQSGVWEFDFYAYVSTAAGVSTLIYDVQKVVTYAGTVAVTGSGTSRTATVTGSTPFVAGDADASVHLASYVQTPLGTFQITAYTSSTVVTIATDVGYVNESGVAFTLHRQLFSEETAEIDTLTTPAEVNTISAQPAFSINTTDKLAIRVYGKTTHTSNVTITLSHNSTEHYSHFHAPLAITHNQLSGLQGGTGGQFYHLTSAEYGNLHVPVTAGTGIGLSGQQVSLSHLGIQSLTDPNAHRLMLWDDTDGSVQWVTVGTGITYTQATHTLSAPATNSIATMNFVIDGGGEVITTGVKGDIVFDFACTINQVTLLADQSGSIVVDIWKDSYANFPPTVADTITASAKPTISAATKSQDSTLTGWTTSIAAGDILRFNVDSVSTLLRATLSLKVTRT